MTDGRQDEHLLAEQLSRHPARLSPNHSGRVADDGLDQLTSAVLVRRQGGQAWVRITGEVTALTRRHLDDWLDWLITAGTARVTVSLPTAEHIDAECLRVLRMAQARLTSLDGELLVTAGRVQVRAALIWAGRGHSVGHQPRRPAVHADQAVSRRPGN